MAGRRRYLVYGAIFVMMAISYIDRVNLSVAAPLIADTFHLGAVQLGYLFSSYLWTYLVLLVPLGVLVDRLGSRRVTAAAMIVWSIGGALTGVVGGYAALLVVRMVLGAGEAASYPAGGRVVREWAPASERGRAASFLNGGAYAGLAVGAILVGWVASTWGWRESFVLTGAIGLVFAVAWGVLYRRPAEAPWLDEDERRLLAVEDGPVVPDAAPRTARRGAVLSLLRSRTMWGLALTQGCAGYTLYFFLTWLPSYLVDERGLDVVRSGLFTAVPYGAAAVLGIVLGRISDRALSTHENGAAQRRRLIAGCLVVSAVILFAPFVDQTWLLLALFSISLTCVSTAMGMCIALTNDLLHDGSKAGVAVSMLIFGGNSFGLVAPILTGYVVAATGSFSAAFGVAGVLLLTGMVVVLSLTRRPIDPETARSGRPVPDTSDAVSA